MVYPTGISIAFILVLFLLFNGPLGLSTILRIFNRGPDSPNWLSLSVEYVSRLLGIGGFVVWLAFTSQSNVRNGLLLGVILL
jgi:hypothetical protein